MTIAAPLDAAAASYSRAKSIIELWTGAQQELLHVHAGLAIFVLTALLFRKRMRSPVPLACVVVFAVVNELFDWWVGKPINTGEPFVDFAHTMLWPAVLFTLARRWR